MALTPDELQRLAARTLAHYDEHADAYWEGTRDHDVAQNVDALLRHIEVAPPFELLDLGCGPGRDLMTFKSLGHRATGLDGSQKLAALARRHSGCTVLEQSFLALELPATHYDGIFANAVLFHLPSQVLPRVLGQLHAALKPGGVLFCSNPPRRGPGRLAGRALWRVSRLGLLARPRDGRWVRRTGPLLSPARSAPRSAALAGQRMAKAAGLKHLSRWRAASR